MVFLFRMLCALGATRKRRDWAGPRAGCYFLETEHHNLATGAARLVAARTIQAERRLAGEHYARPCLPSVMGDESAPA